MQMRSVYLLMVCFIFGSVTLVTVPEASAKSKEIEQKELKLKKLGVKKKKSDLVIKHEKDFTKKLAKLEKEKPSARKKAKQKLVKAHEAFLKQTLGQKTYVAYYKSSPNRKIASEPAKKLIKIKNKKAKKVAHQKKKSHKKATSIPADPSSDVPFVDPAQDLNNGPSSSESPQAAPTDAAADSQAASQLLAPDASGGGHAPASADESQP